MRVVLDTNILARAHHRATGPAREVLTIIRSEPHVLLISPYLLRELWQVLHYPRLLKKHQLTEAEMEEFIDSLLQVATVVYLPPGQVRVSRDPDDDAIVQTAVIGQAEVLSTRDGDLHELVLP